MKVEVVNASRRIGDTQVWSNLNYFFSPGSIHVVTGVSGSGKSTLLNCVGLVDRCSSGIISYDGVELNKASERSRRKYRSRHIGYLFQDYALVDYDTVRANIELGMVGVRSRRQKRVMVDRALERVDLRGRADSHIYELSGGQKQRVALARILVRDVSVILADEPTGALDDTNADMVMGLLRELAEEGVCVIVATHDTNVMDHADSRLDLDVQSKDHEATEASAR